MKNTPNLYSYQEAAFGQLRSAATAFFEGDWRGLRIKPRFDQLIVGPTGCGKTHLAAMLARSVGASLYSITASNWIPSGCSATQGNQSLRAIAAELTRHPRLIVLLDELDKLSEVSSWLQSVRPEIYSLIDRVLPNGLVIPDDDGELETLTDSAPMRLLAARIKLEKNCFLVGAGAFEDLWANSRRQINGFESFAIGKPRDPTPGQLAQVVPREMINRFQVTILPPPDIGDYRRMIEETTAYLPENLIEPFRTVATRNLPLAVRDRRGARFIGESLSQVLMATTRTQGDSTPSRNCEEIMIAKSPEVSA